MSFTKPTISHQLKTVRNDSGRIKTSNLAGSLNLGIDYHARSHLRQNSNVKKVTKNVSVNSDDSNNVLSEIKQCTKLLRNVLTSDALLQKHSDISRKNKSTSTEEYIDQNQPTKLKDLDNSFVKTPWKSILTKSTNPKPNQLCESTKSQFNNGTKSKRHILQQINSQSESFIDDQTEAESISTETVAPIAQSTTIAKNKKLSIQLPNYCNCPPNTGMYNYNNGSYRPAENGAYSGKTIPTASGDKPSICKRCNNLIPTYDVKNRTSMHENSNKQAENTFRYQENDGSHLQNGDGNMDNKLASNLSTGLQANSAAKTTLIHNASAPRQMDYLNMIDSSFEGANKVDNLTNCLHAKLIEMKAVAKSTRDADLDRLVSEIERIFQLIFRENSISLNNSWSSVKNLKLENSSFKQKVKNQNQFLTELKSELKLMKQDHKHKIQELKLEMDLKSKEFHQTTESESQQSIQLREKCIRLEKELEKLKHEYQQCQVDQCHKETEMVQLKHGFTQTENKYKDQINELKTDIDKLQIQLSTAQQKLKKQESELNKSQIVIKSARNQVVGLLERHRIDPTSLSDTANTFPGIKHDDFLNLTDYDNGNNNNNNNAYNSDYQNPSTKAWVQQAASLHRVLSMNSYDDLEDDNFDFKALIPKPKPDSKNAYSNKQLSNKNESPNVSSETLCTSTTSHFASNQKESSKAAPKYSRRSSADIGSDVVNDNLYNHCSEDDNLSTISSPQCGNRAGIIDHNARKPPTYKTRQVSNTHKFSKVHCPSTITTSSAVLSSVSSLKSTDDVEFRSGLKRLDGQISRLQSSLRSKLNTTNNHS